MLDNITSETNSNVALISITDESENKEGKDEEIDEEKKVLPELDKYWKAVNDDPTDFTAWTYLLQYVDQEVLLYFTRLKLN